MSGAEHKYSSAPRCKDMTFPFPDMEFGSPAMDKDQLKRALRDQLYLQYINQANNTGVDHPRDLTGDKAKTYQSYRLAAVGWLVSVIPPDMLSKKLDHGLLMPSVNLMDRYITTLVDSGEDVWKLLKDIHVIRGACFMLSVKMHVTYTELTSSPLAERKPWAKKSLVEDNSVGFTDRDLASVPPGRAEQIDRTSKHIITTLKGGIFPANAENTISVLCKYLILEYFSQTPKPAISQHEAERRVNSIAGSLFTRTALNLDLLKFTRWKCIAVCCLIAMRRVCVTTEEEELHLNMMFANLFHELRRRELTREDICDLTRLLTKDCFVCAAHFVSARVERAVRTLSAMSCTRCCDLKNGNLVEMK